MSDDTLFGEIALKLRLLDHGQLVDCLMKQELEGGQLGEIAVAYGYLDQRQVERVLEAQRKTLTRRGESAVPPMPRARPEDGPRQRAPRPSPARRPAAEEVLLPDFEAAGPQLTPWPMPAAVPAQTPRRTRSVKRVPGPVDAVAHVNAGDAPARPPQPVEIPAPPPGMPVLSQRAAGPSEGAVAPAREPGADAAPARPASIARGRELVEQAIARAMAARASDIHLHTGAPLLLRSDGELQQAGTTPLAGELIEQAIAAVTDDEQWSIYARAGEVDFAYIMQGRGRARVGAYRQQRGPDLVLRLIPPAPPTLRSLNLPEDLGRLVGYRKGMLLCTGPSGCGKSSTLAALLGLVASQRAEHILTIEDPIEYVFGGAGAKAAINQRQLGDHTSSCARALRAALREDPDIIAITELRDPETIALAMTAAETGHLVLGTLNTNGATSTINRIIYSFPAEQQGQIRTMLSESLRAVISQRLVRRKDGQGRVPAMEVLVITPAVANMIRDGKIHQLHSTMQMGAAQGHRLLDASLRQLVDAGVIAVDQARRYATDPKRFA